MSYPGNPSLAADVQARILEAYRHSVESAVADNRDEALLGCDFVLRLDSQFGPAQALRKMLDDQLPAESFRALLEGDEPKPASRAFTAAAPGLVNTFSRLLDARKFEEILSAAQNQSAAVAGDPKLADLVHLAQSRFEAEPMVRQFLDGARKAIGSGKLDQVSDLLEKARELDSTHPGLAEVERLRASAASLQTSLTIDWDEDDDSIGVPPPESSVPTSASAVAAAPPPASAPAFAPTPGDPPPSTVFAEEPPSLDLPEIDFGAVAGLETIDETGEAAGSADGEVSFSTGSEQGGESDARVQALLDEGEEAFARGEYQSSIDAWSRIFLIDIDNGEAAQRIEKARQLKAEEEREVEELFHSGVAHFDVGDWNEAREAFRQVLEQQPSYVLAREYLDKINEREAGVDPPKRDLPEIAPASFGAGEASGAESILGRGRGERIMVPPEPGAEFERLAPAVEGFAIRAKRGNLPSPTFLAIGGAVLVLLLAGGWYLVGNWNQLFPNSKAAPAPAAPKPNPVAEARKLHAAGKTANAIGRLRRIPPQDSKYAEAQSLISQWEKLTEPKDLPELPAERVAERKALIERADAAAEGGESFLAQNLYAQAKAILPLAGDEVRRAAEAEQRTTVFAEELSLIKDGEFEMALNRLWRRHDADPANPDTRRLMVDAYFNLSILDLQRNAPGDARKKIQEALKLDRADPMLQRLDRFCAAYARRPPDLRYRIFVKYLSPR